PWGAIGVYGRINITLCPRSGSNMVALICTWPPADKHFHILKKNNRNTKGNFNGCAEYDADDVGRRCMRQHMFDTSHQKIH
ncbi:MAG: hypothetical protein ACK55Z_03000, partial [bacterium]